jgi:hypothetical protein
MNARMSSASMGSSECAVKPWAAGQSSGTADGRVVTTQRALGYAATSEGRSGSFTSPAPRRGAGTDFATVDTTVDAGRISTASSPGMSPSPSSALSPVMSGSSAEITDEQAHPPAILIGNNP